MTVYRIVSNKQLINDLTGTGAFKVGGRWNSAGTYMLYTSENSSLALLETLVHFDKALLPPILFLISIEVDDSATIYTLPEREYSKDWIKIGNLENKKMGDQLMKSKKQLAIKVRSAINTDEYNLLLNPLHKDYEKLVKVKSVREIFADERLFTS